MCRPVCCMAVLNKMRPYTKETDFIPKSRDMIISGTDKAMSHLILAGIFNSLILMLSHVLYAIHSLAGLFVLSYFHQALENLLLATVYILMVIKVPGRALAVNAGVWGFMGLAMGFWQILVIALPAALAADWFIRARGCDNLMVISAGYSFYATSLAVANGSPLLLMKNSHIISRTARIDPFFAGLMDKVTIPLFFVQVSVSFLAAVAGSMIALRIIKKHFKPAGII